MKCEDCGRVSDNLREVTFRPKGSDELTRGKLCPNCRKWALSNTALHSLRK